MDGAWALYEAWVKIQTGEVESALIYSFGKTSPGDLAEVLALQLDPYCATQLWPDADSIAGIQARLYLSRAARASAISRRSRRAAAATRAPTRTRSRRATSTSRSCSPSRTGPRRSAITTAHQQRRRDRDGDRGGRPRAQAREAPGVDPRHRPPDRSAGARRARSHARASAEIAANKAGVGRDKIDFAELDAPYSHQELILREALGLRPDVRINPSGGSLCTRALFSCGLNRIGDAFARIASGDGDRAVAHATQGHCLQQNLVCVLEGE
jgi:acetyl-CoA acetyltransferase